MGMISDGMRERMAECDAETLLELKEENYHLRTMITRYKEFIDMYLDYLPESALAFEKTLEDLDK